VTYSLGYVPSVELSEISVARSERKDITFSVSRYSEKEYDIFGHNAMVEKVRDYLQGTQLFNRVHYVNFENKSDRHFHFNFVVTGTDFATEQALFMLSGFTLLVIPTWTTINIDSSMAVFVDKKEVYGVSAPEVVKDVLWLPFVVGAPFINHYTTEAHIKRKTMRYFVKNIEMENLY
jgi:hypothetical protein